MMSTKIFLKGLRVLRRGVEKNTVKKEKSLREGLGIVSLHQGMLLATLVSGSSFLWINEGIVLDF